MSDEHLSAEKQKQIMETVRDSIIQARAIADQPCECGGKVVLLIGGVAYEEAGDRLIDRYAFVCMNCKAEKELRVTLEGPAYAGMLDAARKIYPQASAKRKPGGVLMLTGRKYT